MIPADLIKAINGAEKYPCIVKVGVFGSYARNEETPESDIDILVDYDSGSEEYLDNLDDLLEDMERSISIKIGLVTLPGLLKSSNELLKSRILNDVKWIYTKG